MQACREAAGCAGPKTVPRGQKAEIRLQTIHFIHNEAAAKAVAERYETPPLAFVHSYGCQQNVSDGERL